MSIQPSYEPEQMDPSPAFSCTRQSPHVGIVRVTVTGELDLATAPALVDSLAESHDSLVILDLSDVTFADSKGLQAILSAHAQLCRTDRRLVLIPGGRQVRRLFELTGVNKRLEIVTVSEASALEAI